MRVYVVEITDGGSNAGESVFDVQIEQVGEQDMWINCRSQSHAVKLAEAICEHALVATRGEDKKGKAADFEA